MSSSYPEPQHCLLRATPYSVSRGVHWWTAEPHDGAQLQPVILTVSDGVDLSSAQSRGRQRHPNWDRPQVPEQKEGKDWGLRKKQCSDPQSPVPLKDMKSASFRPRRTLPCRPPDGRRHPCPRCPPPLFSFLLFEGIARGSPGWGQEACASPCTPCLGDDTQEAFCLLPGLGQLPCWLLGC